MSFDYDTTGYVDDQQSGYKKKLMPKGNYDFEVVEFTSKDGKTYPMEGKTKDGQFTKVDVLCQVITPGEFAGERIFHSVTFKPVKQDDGTPTPGAGMAIHWLKTLNQPWEGKVTPDPKAWVGERFRGYVVEDEYQGKKSNKIKGIEPIATGTDSGLPF